jgi:hypothetical protein
MTDRDGFGRPIVAHRAQQLASLDNATLVRMLLAAERNRDHWQHLTDTVRADRDNLRTELTTARATIKRLQLERDGAMAQRDAALPIVRAAQLWVASVDEQTSDGEFVFRGDMLGNAVDAAPPDLLALAEAAEDKS